MTINTAAQSPILGARDEVLRKDDPRCARLHQIIDERSLGIGDFILSSGKRSKYHFELRKTTMFGEGMRLIAQIVLDYMKREGLHCIGGKVQGAVPISAAVCLQGEIEAYPIQAFFVRGEEKKHGRGELVDGYVSDKDDILLVDDVATSGGSILDAVKGLHKAYPGTTPRHALVVVDRQQGAEAALAAKGIQLVSLFKRQDFPRIPPEDGN